MQGFKCCIKLLCKVLISAVLHVFWVFPVQKNKVLFINDHSYTFSDNLKYLALYLSKYNEDGCKYSIYFSLKGVDGIIPDDIKAVKFMSLAHFYHALTSSVIITNNSGISYLPIRKSKQFVINTWHGGGFCKVTGVDNIDNYWYRKDLAYNAKKTNIVLSSCDVFTKIEGPGLAFSKEQILNSGMPRMDYYFDKEYKSKIRNKVFEYYQLPKESKLVLYAPTFRGQFENYNDVVTNDMLELDCKSVISALTDRFGGDWVFAIRFHPRLRDIRLSDNSIVNMSRYDDAEELLMSADVLITDYSSVMWDYSFSGNPIFLFAIDIDDYEVNRGFYIPPEQWPYPIATSNEQMKENILGFDQDKYDQAINKHFDTIGNYEKGNSCQMVKVLIDKHLKYSDLADKS